MELRRQDPWAQADRIPQCVIAGNQAPSWVPHGADCSEGVALRGLDAAMVALADDDHAHRTALLRALRASGHDVLQAPGPRSCEQLIADSTHEISALVCCAEMKEMSGFELARRVIRRRPDVRVLLIFRDGSEGQERSAASALGYAHVLDSTTPDEICSRLAGLLGSPESRDRLPRLHRFASGDA